MRPFCGPHAFYPAMKIHLNIGSNLGDRRAMLADAVAAIRRAWPRASVSVSEPVESEPWGYDSPHPFLNIGVMLVLPAPQQPEAVLDTLQAIERTLGHGAPHRNADGSYRDRLIDIDLIAVDTLVVDTPDLVLPHPRMHLREFVLRPMCEVWPGWRHPLLGLTPAEMAALAARQQRF